MLTETTIAQPSGASRIATLRSYGLLMLVTAIWGSTFLFTRQALAHTQPFTFLTIRFSFAAVLLAILFHRRLRAITRTDLIRGLMIGAVLFCALAFQTVGARLTSAGTAGFLVGLSIPVVPLLAVPILRKHPSREAIVGIGLSVLGLALISLNGRLSLHIGMGEVLMICAALTTALHIVVVGKYAPGTDATNLAIVQIGSVAGISFVAMLMLNEPRVAPAHSVLATAVLMGLFATAFALVVMARVQQTVCSTKATLIYALEPVWAGGFGVLAGEALRPTAWGGCGLIFTGMVIGAMRFGRGQRG